MSKTEEKNIPGTGGFMRPEEVLAKLDIKEGMKIADFGCGAGYFAILLAKAVEKEGTVYAVDIQQSALESVQGRARIDSILNIETIRGDLERENGSKLGNKSMDMVMLANILFQSKSKDAILKEAKRVLTKNGRLVVIEWNDDAPFGPKPAYRISKEKLKQAVKDAGFVLEKEFNAGSSHYGLVFSL
jgi:ubiquinone/menaquinone biosynthesis C-methylase UbiE